MDILDVRSLPYMTRRNYVVEFRHMLFWGALAGLIEGQFAAVVVSKSFESGPLLISLATATPFASQLFSLFWGMLCIGRPKVRLVTIFASGVVLCSAAIWVVPVTPIGAIWFVAQVAAAQILLAGVVTVRSAFWKSNYPRSDRGRITARLQALRFLVSAAMTLSAAAASDRDPEAFRIIYPFASLFGIAGIVLLQRLHVRGERRELRGIARRDNEEGDLRPGMLAPFSLTAILSPGHVGRQMVRVLREDRRFATYTVAQFLTGVANLMTVPLVMVVVTRSLPLGGEWEFWISTAITVTLGRLTMLGSMSRWGRLFDRVGVIRFRVVNVLCWASSLVLGLLACVLVVDVPFVTPAAFLASVGLFAAWALMQGLSHGGGALAWNLGHLHFARSEVAEIYMGVHVSLTGFRGLLAPLIGMWLWQSVGLPVWMVWLVALGCSLTSFFIFLFMATQERRLGPPTGPLE